MNRAIRSLRPAMISAGFVFSVWVLWLGGSGPVNSLMAGNRSSIYGTLASICASLLALAIAAVSIMLLYAASPRLAVVLDAGQFLPLARIFFDVIRAVGAATMAAFLGLVFDREHAPAPFFFCLCVVVVAWAIADTVRCIYVLEKVVVLVAAPSKTARSGEHT